MIFVMIQRVIQWNVDIYGADIYPKYSSRYDGLVQERCNSIANALELRLSCSNP